MGPQLEWGLTKQLGPISTGYSHQLVDSTRMKVEIRRKVVHFTIKHRPSIFLCFVLLGSVAIQLISMITKFTPDVWISARMEQRLYEREEHDDIRKGRSGSTYLGQFCRCHPYKS